MDLTELKMSEGLSDGKASPVSMGKEEPVHIERAVSGTDSVGFDIKATKRLLRKIDWKLIPFLSLLYLQVPPHPFAFSIANIIAASPFWTAATLEMLRLLVWRNRWV